MKASTAAAYCDLAQAAFEAEVQSGSLAQGFSLGGERHWSRADLDESFRSMQIGRPVDRSLPAPGQGSSFKLMAYSVSTLADRWQCSGETVRKLIREGKLESLRLGKLIRIPVKAVAEFEGSSGHEEDPNPLDRLHQK